VFDSTGFSAAVRQATGDGVDVVFEHVGPATLAESMRSVVMGGRVVTCRDAPEDIDLLGEELVAESDH